MFGKGGPGIGPGALAYLVPVGQVTVKEMFDKAQGLEGWHARAVAKARNPEMKNSEPSSVVGTSLLDLTGFGGTTVLSSRRADGTIMVIAHPRASKRDWDRVWNRLPIIEVEEFDYHIKPDGTEVYVITPGKMTYPNRCDGTPGCCA